MEPRIYHGNLKPETLAQALIAQFDRGNLRAQQIGSGERLAVQIASRQNATSGGQTALTVSIQQVADGVAVQIGQQNWLGLAASLGRTAFETWLDPWRLIQRLDDLAQDFENFQLTDQVWVTLENAARAAGASTELSERLRRMECAYCNTANPVGQSSCLACGAPLGAVQPRTCLKCGFVLRGDERTCPNCRQAL